MKLLNLRKTPQLLPAILLFTTFGIALVGCGDEESEQPSGSETMEQGATSTSDGATSQEGDIPQQDGSGGIESSGSENASGSQQGTGSSYEGGGQDDAFGDSGQGSSSMSDEETSQAQDSDY